MPNAPANKNTKTKSQTHNSGETAIYYILQYWFRLPRIIQCKYWINEETDQQVAGESMTGRPIDRPIVEETNQ